MYQQILDLLFSLGWVEDESYSTAKYATFFMDETDECFVRLYLDGRWEVWEYERKVADGRTVAALNAHLYPNADTNS
jgi:hypothetical protein